MILTDKAKEDFLFWLLTAGNEEIQDGSIEYDLYYLFKYMLPEKVKNNLIIEWLDSVEIYLNISFVEPYGYFMYFIHRNGWTVNETALKDRITAIEKAIEKANEIYNS